MRNRYLILILVVCVGAGQLSTAAAAQGVDRSNGSTSLDWQIRGVYLAPTNRDSIFPLSNQAYAEFAGTLRMGPHWSTELAFGIPTDFNVAGATIYAPTFNLQINTATINYGIPATGPWQLYGGVGLAYVPIRFTTTDRQASAPQFHDSSTSLALRAGFRVELSRYVFMDADLRYLSGLDARRSGEFFPGERVAISPLLLGVGIGVRLFGEGSGRWPETAQPLPQDPD